MGPTDPAPAMPSKDSRQADPKNSTALSAPYCPWCQGGAREGFHQIKAQSSHGLFRPVAALPIQASLVFLFLGLSLGQSLLALSRLDPLVCHEPDTYRPIKNFRRFSDGCSDTVALAS